MLFRSIIHKVGDIIEAKFPSGDEQEYVDNGLIEIVGKQKPNKKVKNEVYVKGVGLVEVDKKENIKKEVLDLTVEKIKEELYKVVNLGPLEQDEIIEKLVLDSGKKESSIRKQLSIIKKEKKKEQQNVNKILSDEMVSEDKISLREKVLSLFQRKDFGEGTELLVKEIENNKI